MRTLGKSYMRMLIPIVPAALLIAWGSYVMRPDPAVIHIPLLSETEARGIASKNCAKDKTLNVGTYNPISKTWWFDADLNTRNTLQNGCDPACVVWEDTGTVEVNWRCTGFIQPDPVPASGQAKTGIIQGVVLKGPVCPMQTDPPRPECADQPYPTTVKIIAAGSPLSSPYATVRTGSKGEFSVNLPPGDYSLQPQGGNPYPRCETKRAVLRDYVILKMNLRCDTGIR